MMTWRVVLADGSVRAVAPQQPCPQSDGSMRWSVDGAGSHSTQRGAVLAACMRGVDVREILAPGELTAEERVAAERARCAAVCRGVRLSRDGDDERAAAEACAEAIERGEVGR